MRVSQLVARHERALMRVALHWSLCRDDALDAYQRALEIYVRRLETLDPATEIGWMKVVVKHEALAVRRQRTEVLSVEDVEVDLDARTADAQRSVDDLLASRERVERSAEALRHLKHDEAQALMLKSNGLSYREICESLGWTYTKVNRCITEGRARFLKVYAKIEAGTECERFAPTLAALVAGTATGDALLELRPHIRHCATCRATVRGLHATRLGRLAALLPVPALLVPLRWVRARLSRGETIVETRREETIAGLDPATDVVNGALERTGGALAGLRQHASAAYVRAVDPTPLAGVRPGAAVATLAGCLALGGGTTYCVTEGVDPIAGITHVIPSARERKQPEPPKRRRAPQRVSTVATPTATPIGVATPEPTEALPPAAEPTPRSTPEPTPEPIPEEEYEPLAPATAASTVDESPPAPARTPAPAAAAGPGEFDGP